MQYNQMEKRNFPVAYISRTLTKAERSYDTKKREGLSIVWGLNKLRHYLLGTHFEVKTDHGNLRWILEAHHIKDPQIARWRAVLSQYDFRLSYEKNVAVADALSRDPRFEKVIHLVDVDDMIGAVTCHTVEGKLRVRELERPLTCIELGCGGGGTGIGLTAAGYTSVLGVDISVKALRTYRKLFPQGRGFELDMMDEEALKQALREVGRVGLIAITTPCAPFSTAKHGGVALEDDPRAELFIIAVRAAVQAQPDALLIENVTGILRSPHWQIAKMIMAEGGYTVEHANVNAST